MNVIRDVREVPVGAEPQVIVEHERFRLRTRNWRRTLERFLAQLRCRLELLDALGGSSIVSHGMNGPRWQPMPSSLHRPNLSQGCVYGYELDEDEGKLRRQPKEA
jgi:hypothetical protein